MNTAITKNKNTRTTSSNKNTHSKNNNINSPLTPPQTKVITLRRNEDTMMTEACLESHDEHYFPTQHDRDSVAGGCLLDINHDHHIPLKPCASVEDFLAEEGLVTLEDAYHKMVDEECFTVPTFDEFTNHLIRQGVKITTSIFILPVDMDYAASFVDIPLVLQLTGPVVPYLTREADDPRFFVCGHDIEALDPVQSRHTRRHQLRTVFSIPNASVVRTVRWEDVANAVGEAW